MLDASEAEVLLEAAKKSRKVVFEAAHYRFHPAARRPWGPGSAARGGDGRSNPFLFVLYLTAVG